MAIIFYILGWLGVLGGLGWAGYLLYTNMSAAGVTQIDAIINYVNTIGFALMTPGLTITFIGLLLLAVGGVLSRLDEIAYNTRSMG